MNKTLNRVGAVATHGTHVPVRIIVHDAESDSPGIRGLEGIANYWRGQGLGYGAHRGISVTGDEAVWAADSAVTWHTENRNTGSLGVELEGYGRFTRRVWLARPAQLHRLAKLLAYWSHTHGIPLVRDVTHGVSGHADQTRAFHLSSGHTDPGAGFPWPLVMAWARAAAKRHG